MLLPPDTKTGQDILIELLEGDSYPNKISKKLHKDASTVVRSLRELKKSGYVTTSKIESDLLDFYTLTDRGKHIARLYKNIRKEPHIRTAKKNGVKVLFI